MFLCVFQSEEAFLTQLCSTGPDKRPTDSSGVEKKKKKPSHLAGLLKNCGADQKEGHSNASVIYMSSVG